MKFHQKTGAALTALCLMAGHVQAATTDDPIYDTLSDMCTPADRQTITDAARANIESKVARAEAAIRPPASIVDLSCMTDLLGADLDVFSSTMNGLSGLGSFNVTKMINDIGSGLKKGLSTETLTSGVTRAMCSFAKEKYEEVTEPLTGTLAEITSRATGTFADIGNGFKQFNLDGTKLDMGYTEDGNLLTAASAFSTGTASTSSAGTTSVTSSVSSTAAAQAASAAESVSTAVTNLVTGSEAESTEALTQSIWNSLTGGN